MRIKGKIKRTKTFKNSRITVKEIRQATFADKPVPWKREGGK